MIARFGRAELASVRDDVILVFGKYIVRGIAVAERLYLVGRGKADWLVAEDCVVATKGRGVVKIERLDCGRAFLIGAAAPILVRKLRAGLVYVRRGHILEAKAAEAYLDSLTSIGRLEAEEVHFLDPHCWLEQEPSILRAHFCYRELGSRATDRPSDSPASGDQ